MISAFALECIRIHIFKYFGASTKHHCAVHSSLPDFHAPILALCSFTAPYFMCFKTRDSPRWYKSFIKKTSFVNLLRILEEHISASTDSFQQGLANSLSYTLQVLKTMTAPYLWAFQKLQQKNTDNTQSFKS